MGVEDAFLHQQHKLCGFLRVVVSVSSPPQQEGPGPPTRFPAPGVSCTLSGNGSAVGFVSEDGFLLTGGKSVPSESLPLPTPVQEDAGIPSPRKQRGRSLGSSGNLPTPSSRKRRRKGAGRFVSSCSPTTPPSSRRRKGLGFVNGSMSVVYQLHALTAHKCLRIECRVVGIADRGHGAVRGVVLVDVYLPIALWSGWQFPRSSALAASLFSHLSCNWELRSSLLAFGSIEKYLHEDDESTWKNSDCDVLGCNFHCNFNGFGHKKLFDLHEIFKSLPSIVKEEKGYPTRIKLENASLGPGIWDLADDVLTNVLASLGPRDLVSVASTCRHLRSLTVSIMPCMKLKLFPHQQAAIEWMLKRERNSDVLPHPLYMDFSTEDGFHFYMNGVSGEVVTGMAPTIRDFNGGLFCDEPGLGKTVTALSLILKTHGSLTEPPHGVDVVWCMHNPDQRCGYYELSADKFTPGSFTTLKRFTPGVRRRQIYTRKSTPEFCPSEISKSSLKCTRSESSKSSLKRVRSQWSELFPVSESLSSDKSDILSCTDAQYLQTSSGFRSTRSLSRAKRNLLDSYGRNSDCASKTGVNRNANGRKHNSNVPKLNSFSKHVNFLISCKRSRKANAGHVDSSETWVQCDACKKWRKLPERSILDATAAWFCSMNSDSLYQACTVPEESWDYRRSITYLPGFYTKGTSQGKGQNISFFTSVLKDHCTLINSETKKALKWLSNLSHIKLLEMETSGLTRPVLDTHSCRSTHEYHKIFQAFGLVRKIERGTARWYYPHKLENLAFDLKALQVALTKPLDSLRFYLSRATLIIVPANLVEHWKTQIQRHVRPGQLRIYVWADHKKPCAHNLAWDYDIVITTFNRLSAEWGLHKRSVLMQVHWLRVMLDEGHTLGSSLCLTNKLQMAISLTASYRWILTGTPTPNTPNSQVAHLQPMLKFLHEEAYGQHQESWDAGILRPFEAEMEEGRSRLLQLLRRTMISARKTDLKTIPPCIKKVTFLDFTEEHSKSYNELVATVRRNILMADWNDPSHVESLLNPKQWKLRSNTIRNVRLSCCVAGHIKVTDAGQDIQETMDILVQQGLDPLSEEYGFIKSTLLNGDYCLRCGDWCRLPVITPCRHLLCLDCVALDSERCTFPGCGNPYEMQCPELLARPENPNPKWPVPKDLIELQPSYKQDNWDPDWHATSSSKVAYLVERLKDLQEANVKLGYCIGTIDGSEELVTNRKKHSTSLVQQYCANKPNYDSYSIMPEKVIIFSQFLEHIHVIEQQLTIAGIRYAGMYSPMHSSNKMKSLMIFQHDANCMALLMDGSAALGLDLSFVTHVFLMEPIWDRSMEEQVISRAHRMGAVRPVHVETLAMRGTIEEQMLGLLQNTDGCRGMLKEDIADFEGIRAHGTLHDFAGSNYLAQLSVVRTHQNMK
uniref:F-box protein At3g54460 n=1 Tax=Anthurium amnicola TaxID=1678845 RepID=A0A1D1XU40_9ARAE